MYLVNQMELIKNLQISFNELCNERIDYFIASPGYQRRSTFLAENLKNKDVKKLLFDSDAESGNSKAKNLKVFEELGFDSIQTNNDEKNQIQKIIRQIFNDRKDKQLNILIDYSSMTKTCYASVIDFLLKNEFDRERINMFFSYTPKIINALPSKSKCKSIEPIFNYVNKENDKKTALILGLNSNEEPSREIVKSLLPEKVCYFIPYLRHDKDYNTKLYKLNSKLLENVPAKNIFNYPAQMPGNITAMMVSACLDLRLNYNVVVIPQGPKTFALASIFLAIRYPDIKLMEINSVEKRPDDEGLPAGDPVIVKSVFCSEEESDEY